MPLTYKHKSASISPDGIYRYQLVRVWDESLNTLAWIMLNPSTADGEKDDATIRRVVGFSSAWGYGSARIYNLFALRATNPKELYDHPDPVGPENDLYLKGINPSTLIIAAWGRHATKFKDRMKDVAQIINGRCVSILGRTKDGEPVHPLFLPSTVKLMGWGEK